MMNIMLLGMLISMIAVVMLMLNKLISKKAHTNREKSSPYECGFDPLNAMSESFSIQFFLISIMFLTFDIEIVILIPLVPTYKLKNIEWLMSSTLIIVILMVGLLLEWSENSIKWEK